MRRVTKWVIGFTATALVIYDLIPAVRKGQGDTISEVLRDAAHEHPIIAFAAGLLVGHWWFTPSPHSVVVTPPKGGSVVAEVAVPKELA